MLLEQSAFAVGVAEPKRYFTERYDDDGSMLPALWIGPLPRKHIFQVTLQIKLLNDFTYWTGPTNEQFMIVIPAGIYDGFSVPWIARILSLGQLGPVMAGMSAAFVHDWACLNKVGTREWRRKLFVEAYDSAMLQFYGEYDSDAWANIIKRGVLIGSKHFSAC